MGAVVRLSHDENHRHSAVPPVAERIRSLASLAVPTHVSLPGSPLPASPARGGVDGRGRPVLPVKPGEPLHGRARGTGTPVTVDLTACRDLGGLLRPRGPLKVRGRAQAVPAERPREAAVGIAERCPDADLFEAVERPGDPEAPRLPRVDVAFVIYILAQESGTLEADEYLSAVPDPLQAVAERLVNHVNEAHRARLRAAVARPAGVTDPEVRPWELDRYGTTVRVGDERPTPIRLPWPAPVATPRALEHALHHVLCP